MKTFSSSDLSKTPAKVLAAAREDGAIIQIRRTNGEVIEEFLIISKPEDQEVYRGPIKYDPPDKNGIRWTSSPKHEVVVKP